MKALNRNRYFSGFSDARRARRYSVWLLRSRWRAAWAGPRRSRCAPQSNLDTIAYGQRLCAARRCAVAYARRRRRCRYDAAYHLDAGDKLRVVVYGQEGLTNTYAIDAGGSITMPLIGSVPARGRTPAGLAAEISAKLRGGYHPRALGRGGDRGLPAVLHPRRGRGSRPISLCAEHDGRERGGDRRRLLAARPARPGHAHPYRCIRHRRASWCRPAPPSAPAIPYSSANAGSDHARARQTSRFVSCTRRARRSAASSATSSTSPTARPSAATMSASSPTASPAANAPSGAGGNRAAPEARRSPHRHSPRAAPDRCPGMGAVHAPDPPAEAGRAAWPRRQGRRLHPPEAAAPTGTIRVYTPHGGSLHYPLNTLKGAIYAASNAR